MCFCCMYLEILNENHRLHYYTRGNEILISQSWFCETSSDFPVLWHLLCNNKPCLPWDATWCMIAASGDTNLTWFTTLAFPPCLRLDLCWNNTRVPQNGERRLSPACRWEAQARLSMIHRWHLKWNILYCFKLSSSESIMHYSACFFTQAALSFFVTPQNCLGFAACPISTPAARSACEVAS